MAADSPFDGILLVSFGGPERPEDVRPFLANVLRGRNVPPARVEEVARNYEACGGRSPINAQNRALLAALRSELDRRGVALPLFWGNRNWHPLLGQALQEMSAAGVRRALACVTSAYGSYSGCRQYREDLERARAEAGIDAPDIQVLRRFYNHPGFVAANVERVHEAFARVAVERRGAAALVFTAHSIPLAMAESSPYLGHLRETCGLVAGTLVRADWSLVFQSRSGPPAQPWLEPDLLAHLRGAAGRGVRDVVLVPIGFVSDHMEVVYDLDVQAQAVARELGLNLVRAATVGTHPAFVAMIADLIDERLKPGSERRALGSHGPYPDVCPPDCCPSPHRGP